MKSLVIVLFVACLAGADPLSLPFYYATSDTPTAAKTNANNNAIKNVVNGNLANDNIKTGANISQSKIDSASGGWITDVTGYFTSGTQTVNQRSPYGLHFYINDSTTYDKEFLFVTDSTDSIAKMENDSITVWKDVRISGQDIMGADSVQVRIIIADSIDAKITATDSILTSVGIRSSQDIVAGNDLKGDSAIGSTGIRTGGTLTANAIDAADRSDFDNMLFVDSLFFSTTSDTLYNFTVASVPCTLYDGTGVDAYGTATYLRVNKTIFMNLPNLEGEIDTVMVLDLPTSLMPAADTYVPISIYEDGATKLGLLKFTSGGGYLDRSAGRVGIVAYDGSAVTTSSLPCGIYPTQVSWEIE